jgi:hypothetical protein
MNEDLDSVEPDQDGHRVSPKAFVPALLVGLALISVGVRSALGNQRDSHPSALVAHVVGFDLAHDLLLAPIALFVGWIIKKILPPYARGPIRGAIAISSMFVVFAYPLVRRWGKRPGNPSTLPLPYGTNLAIIVGIVWITAAVIVARRRLRVSGPES